MVKFSLHGTIINLAQNYCNSNNINLFVPEGQFGTRLKGGKDSAQPRYIHTYLTNIANVLYDKRDEPFFKDVYDDGLKGRTISLYSYSTNYID